MILMAEEEKEERTAESTLAPQLGTDFIDLMRGRVDVRRLTYLNELEIVWLSYFLMIPNHRGGRFARRFCENYMNLKMSEGGRRVNQMIQMVAGSRGVPVFREVDKRSWVERHLTLRDEEKAREKGKIAVE
ncbi:MAG: hypothetical protein ACTSX6_10455 [Candidatus Heimdallarchaeaceae archaeon]